MTEIDGDRDGKVTADEIRQALMVRDPPATPNQHKRNSSAPVTETLSTSLMSDTASRKQTGSLNTRNQPSQKAKNLKEDITAMLPIIRKGDKTTHGGAVLTCSSTMKFGGIGVARKGDKVSCPVPEHGMTVIIEGNPRYLDNGIPVAFQGHKCACGCSLISSFVPAKVA